MELDGSLQGQGMTTMAKNGTKRIRVGIIGANPDRGWAAVAHIPALKSLSHDFEITALSTSRRESADAASRLFGVPVAFDNHRDLVNRADVDVVAITVKVPYHLELATAALGAGKAVYCEWPLGTGLKEAETLAALAKKKGVLAVAGLQARSAPSVAYAHDLIKQGYVGEVLSTTLIGSGMGWGPTVEPYNAYLNDKKNGATMLSIALGHAADALCHCLGEMRELSATTTVRRKSFTIAETGESRPMTAEDQVCVTGLLEGGAAFSIHYRGGHSRVSPATIARERISAPRSTTPSHAIACWTRSRRLRQPAGVKRPARRDRTRFSACYSTTTFQEIKDEDLSGFGNCRPFFGRAG